MARYSVGSVPYLNAKPLVKPLMWQGVQGSVEVEFDVPSRLPALLDSGRVQAIMVSSISALTDSRAMLAEGLSISTQREVLSVRLFSKKPFEQIETLAEDESSMTSNALAKIVLGEKYGCFPVGQPMAPNGEAMLENCDACVLIGDKGMSFERPGAFILDLGQAWHHLTELPFVWAVWKGSRGLTPELVALLQDSLASSRRQMDRVIHEASSETGFSAAQCEHYLLDIMDYRLTETHLRGLSKFGEYLCTYRLVDNVFAPKIVSAVRPLPVR